MNALLIVIPALVLSMLTVIAMGLVNRRSDQRRHIAPGHWLVRRAGRRGAFLLFLVILDGCYGYALLSASIAALRSSPNLLLSMHTWGWVWAGVGAICLTGVFARHDWFQYTLAAALKTVWAGLYARLWVAGGLPQAWISVVVWGAFAMTIVLVGGWPEQVRPPDLPPVTLPPATLPEDPP